MISNVNTPPVTPTITGIVDASLKLSGLEGPVVIKMLPTISMSCMNFKQNRQDLNFTEHIFSDSFQLQSRYPLNASF